MIVRGERGGSQIAVVGEVPRITGPPRHGHTLALLGWTNNVKKNRVFNLQCKRL